MIDPIMLFWLFEFFGDLFFVVRIFMLITIISFVVNHLGKGPLAIVLIVGFSTFMILAPTRWFFEWVYVLMMLLTFGISGILIDFFFVGGGASGGEQTPISSGADLAKRAAATQAHRGASGMMRRMRGR